MASGEEKKTPSTSPKSKLKILCSHGGKILPRPTDGHLKYVGGETRVVALPRDITYTGDFTVPIIELMKKLADTFEGEMVLKYQLIPEELDALVSVRSDDDLRFMLDEYERQETGGSPKLRAFLFPPTPIIVHNQSTTKDRPMPLEQRYIDAINGIIRKAKLDPVDINRPSFSISSACSSPKTISPDGYNEDQESAFSNGTRNGRLRSMHKVRSSPSLSSLNDQQSNNRYNHHHHQIHHQHHHHYYNNHPHYTNHSSSRPPQDPHRSGGNERLSMSPFLNNRVDSLRGQMSCVSTSDYYYSQTRNPRGVFYGNMTKALHFDDSGGGAYECNNRLGCSDSLPRSPGRILWE